MLPSARIGLLALAAAIVPKPALLADFVTISQPDAAYVGGTTRLAFTDSDGTMIAGGSAGGETLIYSSNLVEYTVPSSWAAWGTPPAVETSTPRVGFTNGVSSLGISLINPAKIFGFELEPDDLATQETTAAFYSGSLLVGTIDLFPDGNGGALLYAASTTTNPFTRVVITNLAGRDFAIAQERFALAVPEPGTLVLLIAALAALALLGRFTSGRTRGAYCPGRCECAERLPLR
jgi:hypothetical protein